MYVQTQQPRLFAKQQFLQVLEGKKVACSPLFPSTGRLVTYKLPTFG